MLPFGSNAPVIKRYTVRSPAEADAPRTRRELNALCALGAILNKRAWWTKWTKRPEVQRKWIRELEDALVRAHVTQVLAVWPLDGAVARTQNLMNQLHDIASLTGQPEKKAEQLAKIEALVAHVLYPADADDYTFDEGANYSHDWNENEEDTDASEDELGDGEDDSEDETALDQDGNVVAFDVAMEEAKKACGVDQDGDTTMDDGEASEEEEDEELEEVRRKQNPFGQLAWFVTMSLVREKLLALAPADWTEPTLRAIVDGASVRASEDVVARTCELILSVVRASDGAESVSMDTVESQVPEETRDDVLRLLQLHFDGACDLLNTTKNDISTVLDVIIKRLALPAKDEPMIDAGGATASSLYTPGPAPHVWLSDDCIATELKGRFRSLVATLENVPDSDKDWHPNSNGQVLDVVHPSLYCGVVGQTLRLPQSAAKRMYGSPAEHMHAIMFEPAKSKLAGPKKLPSYTSKATQFQWLPCEVDVADKEEGGRASILTYINNLHPETHVELYQSIEQIFTRFVPLFDTVLSSLDNQARERGTKALYDDSDASLPCAPSLVPPGLFETREPHLSLLGTRCQVIVKIAEIHLTPASPSYAGGAWHIEGTDAERIIATGLYYFGSDNISESRLSFRTFVQTPEYEQSDDVGVALTYGLQNDELLVQHLGSVTAMEDRCVVFPNIYQHKVEPFELLDPTKPGVRKILAFFLVDPTAAPIASTAVVPPQQQTWIDLAREPQLKRLRVPETVVKQIKDLAREGMSLDEAKGHRVQLMAERSAASREGDFEFVLSLCEH
jgi:hypothetical protein